MKIKIEFIVDPEGDITEQVLRAIMQCPNKIKSQLTRDSTCICTLLEADDLIKDYCGNNVGTVSVER